MQLGGIYKADMLFEPTNRWKQQRTKVYKNRTKAPLIIHLFIKILQNLQINS